MIAKCLAIYSTLLPTLSSHPHTPNKPEIRGYLGVHSRGEETDASPETTGNELNPVFVQAPSLPNKQISLLLFASHLRDVLHNH